MAISAHLLAGVFSQHGSSTSWVCCTWLRCKAAETARSIPERTIACYFQPVKHNICSFMLSCCMAARNLLHIPCQLKVGQQFVGRYIAMVVVTYKTTHLSVRVLNEQPLGARFLPRPRLLHTQASAEAQDTTCSIPLTNKSATAVGASKSELPRHSKLPLAKSKALPAQ